jgi:hypothetical protein
MTEPNCTASELARGYLDTWMDLKSHLLQELRWQAQKPYVATPRLLFYQQKKPHAGSDAVLSHFR